MRLIGLIVPAVLLSAALASGGCSSKNGSSAKRGGGANSASAAKANGQVVGQTAKADEGSAQDEGAGGGGGGALTENGGAHDATAAKAANEKVGAKAKADEAKAADEGTTTASFRGPIHVLGGDEDAGPTGVACDGEHQDEGFCADATHLVFCDHDHWYKLDCAEAENGDHCAEDTKTDVVDCHATSELAGGDTLHIDAPCDEHEQGTAYCSDADHVVFCDGGHWHALACGASAGGTSCEEDDESHVVDCAHDGDALSAAH